MANQSGSPEENPFDLARLRQLVRLMRDNDLSEVDLRWNNAKLRLCRGPQGIATTMMPTGYAPAAPIAPPPVDPSGDKGAAKPEAAGLIVKSPIVGTFYVAAGPDSPPFVTIGSRVQPETTVCIIEAMKVFNEIPAGISGVVKEVLVENGGPVEYGQPLFRLEP